MSMEVGTAVLPTGGGSPARRRWRGAMGLAAAAAIALMAGCGHVNTANSGSSSASSSTGASSAAKSSASASSSAASLATSGGSNCAAGTQGTQYNVVAPRVGALAVNTPAAACWKQIPLTPFYNDFFSALPKGKTAPDYGGFQTAWSSKYLFVNVTVNKWPLLDSTTLPIYEVDEVEIGVGPNDRAGNFTSQEGYGQMTFDGKNGIVKIYGSTKTPAEWLTKVNTGHGYNAEAIIPLSDIGVSAAKGSIIGLSVGADIPVPPTGQRSFVLWAGVFGFWSSDAQWGTITLG